MIHLWTLCFPTTSLDSIIWIARGCNPQLPSMPMIAMMPRCAEKQKHIYPNWGHPLAMVAGMTTKLQLNGITTIDNTFKQSFLLVWHGFPMFPVCFPCLPFAQFIEICSDVSRNTASRTAISPVQAVSAATRCILGLSQVALELKDMPSWEVCDWKSAAWGMWGWWRGVDPSIYWTYVQEWLGMHYFVSRIVCVCVCAVLFCSFLSLAALTGQFPGYRSLARTCSIIVI